jgi:heterodisulfide reductase subunit D
MNAPTFETALSARIDEMVDACTRCGKCVEACPSVAPAGIAAAPQDVIAGVLDIVRTGSGPEASRKWASACMLSGDCIKACDEDVNPRFLLAMARVAMAKANNELPDRRRRGIETFRNLGRDVGTLSRLQLSGEDLVRLGQRAGSAPAHAGTEETPDFVFYTGCNVLKTPHIALLALDIMDALDISYRVMGGPTHCCGVVHMRAGDPETSGRMTTATVDKLSQSKSGEVLAWCPSCFVQFTETTLPTVEKQRGAKPFEMTPFMRFLARRLDDLRPLLRTPVNLRVALHRHPGVAGAMEAAETVLRAVPGLELVDLKQPAVGLQSVNLSVLPAYKREVQLKELEAARDAKVDVLAAVYHSDHRELCAHERDWPFRIVNVLELIGESMGLSEQDNYKRLKVLQDADAILNDCGDLIVAHGLDPAVAREVVLKGMLADQPLPLRGS